MTDFIRPPADTTTGKRVHASVHNDGTNDIYTQVVHLADRLNPDQKQAVDNKGASFVRFSEGSPDFDAFGRTTVSEPNLMGMYKFYQEDYAEYFYKQETGGATVTHDTALRGIKLSCSTASGDFAGYHSHRHYHYRPGNTMTLTWTMKGGDAGATNVVRRAGWITPDNGLYFEMDETGIYCCIKNGNLSTVTRIERANWNGDRLDGSGGDNNLSGATINPLKNNIWWIDFQYLGAGAIRFGTYVDGDKVVCHTQGNYNVTDRPYMSSSSLSFGVEQETTGVTGATAEMHIFCVVITNDGYDEFDVTPISIRAEKTLTSTSFVPLLSFKPTELHHGLENRDRILPQIISILSGTEPVELRADLNVTLTGDTYAGTVKGVEYDTTATTVDLTGAESKIGMLVAAGRSEAVDLTPVFKLYKDGVTRHYDNATTDHITISARLMSGTSSLVAIILNILEIE